MKIKVEELNKIKNFILKHPDMIEMERYVQFGESGTLLSDKENPHCGSVGCIAGLTVAMNYKKGLTEEKSNEIEKKFKEKFGSSQWWSGRGGIWYKARIILGLDEYQADLLFLPSKWPDDLREELDEVEYKDTDDRSEYARIVAKRIDYFIEYAR